MDYKQARLRKGITQKAVAIAVGLSLTGYQLIEDGVTKKPRADTVEKLKNYLREEVKK